MVYNPTCHEGLEKHYIFQYISPLFLYIPFNKIYGEQDTCI